MRSLSRPYEGCLIMGGIRFSSGKEAGQSAMADKFHVSTSAPRACKQHLHRWVWLNTAGW
jgi:hypothetical protein